ncbi:MAG: hypothetical protein PHD95_04920 [Candidatus ainarchaeum sp.]|nr:hypothetical protein [Candidatus ainarchaeum sp.]
MDLQNVRTFLSGTQNGIEDYCDACINHEQIFFYASGEKNTPLFEFDIHKSKDWEVVKCFPTASICSGGGIPLGRAFNTRMLVHVKKNFSKLTEENKK